MGRTAPGSGRAAIAGRYLLLDRIAGGGMSAVWRAYDLRDQGYVAAKVLAPGHPSGLLRFVAEQSLRVQHPHVMTPTGWAAEDGAVVFAMPLVHGGTLEDLLHRHGSLPAPYVAVLLRQLLEALDAVHRAGVVHRDVKPSNLLLEATGTGPPVLRLADFGVAVQVGRARLTLGAGVVGTQGYMPPEQEAGAAPVPGHDLYAAGVVAREALTGCRSAAAPRDADRAGGLAELLAWLTHPRPDQRPESARAVLGRLAGLNDRAETSAARDRAGTRSWVVGPDSPDVPDRLGPAPRLPRSRSRPTLAAVATASAAGLALLLSATALVLAVAGAR